MPRTDGRAPDQLRKIEYILDVAPHAAGSVLIAFGNTRVICTACINEEVPRWMKVQGVKGGWLTAEYSMLPYSTLERKDRESSRGKPDGRSTEIQRLIGRSLRAVVDLEKLGPARSTSIATCSRPTAAPAPRPSPAPASPSPSLSTAFLKKARSPANRSRKRSPPSASASSKAKRCSTSATPKTPPPMSIATSSSPKTASSSKSRAAAKKSTFTEAQLHSMLEYGRKGIKELVAIQDEAITSAMKPAEGKDLQKLAEFFGKR
jgi:ribonuclease PH